MKAYSSAPLPVIRHCSGGPERSCRTGPLDCPVFAHSYPAPFDTSPSSRPLPAVLRVPRPNSPFHSTLRKPHESSLSNSIRAGNVIEYNGKLLGVSAQGAATSAPGAKGGAFRGDQAKALARGNKLSGSRFPIFSARAKTSPEHVPSSTSQRVHVNPVQGRNKRLSKRFMDKENYEQLTFGRRRPRSRACRAWLAQDGMEVPGPRS